MMPEGPAIKVESLTRRFGGVTALNHVSLSIAQGEFFSLLGPSGCGKTTLLRIIAGLDVADEGTVSIGGIPANELPAHRRPVNTVFQSYALFPHLNVRENVAFGLRMKKVPAQEIAERVSKMMALTEIEPLAERRPNQLSGGQKQRVALARAIVNEPKVLLLDEPLGALDLKLRKQLQMELRNLQRRLGITFIYVTHDQDEALVLSDRIAVMKDGQVEQMGEAATLYEKPRTRFVSQFLGSCSLLESTVQHSGADHFLVDSPVGNLRVATKPSSTSKITLAIRPEKIHLAPAGAPLKENEVRVNVQAVVYVGSGTHYELRCGNQVLLAECINSNVRSQGFPVGTEAIASLPPDALIVLED